MIRPIPLSILLLLGGCVSAPAPAPVAHTVPPPVARPVLPPPPELVSAARFGLPAPLRQGGLALGQAPAGTLRRTLDGAPVHVADDGRFLIAFDRDAKPQATLVAALANGRCVATSQ